MPFAYKDGEAVAWIDMRDCSPIDIYTTSDYRYDVRAVGPTSFSYSITQQEVNNLLRYIPAQFSRTHTTSTRESCYLRHTSEDPYPCKEADLRDVEDLL